MNDTTAPQNSKCWDADELDIIHRNHADTGRTGINPLTGDTYQVWVCGCGGHEFQVFPA